MSCEYWTIVSCAKQLKTALRPPESDLVYFLHRNGFISEETCRDVLNPRSILRDDQKAQELIDGIMRQVKLSPQKYHDFINYLHAYGNYYRGIVAILNKEYLREQEMSACQKKQERKEEGELQLMNPLFLGHRRTSLRNIICNRKISTAIVIAVCSVLIAFLLLRLHFSETSTYETYLKKIYAKQMTDSKWPAIATNSYINLAIVSHTPDDLEQIREHILHGNVTEILKGKESIELENIFKRKKLDIKEPSLLLIEGAPGIGKTTLTWELCRRWRNESFFMKHFSLVVLHRFREKSTQQISNVRDLFPHENKNLQQLTSDEVIAREGKGVLFILDGFDEFPHKASHDNFLIKLIKGKHLPDSTVLVTTRPAATATFLTHRPDVDQRIEILGFTQEQVKEFANDTFSKYEPEVLNNFMKYIEASENPAINSLMYIPLNAAIIAEIYKRNYKMNLPVPKTLTQLYTELCLTLLRRFLTADASIHNAVLNHIEDLSGYDNYYSHFQDLSQVAFEEFSKEKAIIHTLPTNSIHFGLLDSVQALHGGGEVSYNFLHLTIQEFLAAYHISHHDTSEKQAYNKYGHEKRWELVWRFVAGFTKFDYFVNSTQDEVFVDVNNEIIEVKMFFFLCLFEVQIDRSFNLRNIYKETKAFQVAVIWPFSLSPMDMYVIGHFLVNSAPTVSWELQLAGKALETFVWGLNSLKSEKGIIQKLKLTGVSETHLDNFPEEILHNISQLSFVKSDLSAVGKAIAHLKNLKSLVVSSIDLFNKKNKRDLSYVYQQLSAHSITLQELDLGVDFLSHKELSDLLKGLIHPESGSLKSLLLSANVCPYEALTNMIFNSSSLDTLFITCSRSDAYFTLLETNSNLKNLTLRLFDIPSHYSFKNALMRNKQLQYLNLEITDKVAMTNCRNLRLLTEAMQHSTLKELSITIKGGYDKLEEDYADLKTDYRIAILSVNLSDNTKLL